MRRIRPKPKTKYISNPSNLADRVGVVDVAGKNPFSGAAVIDGDKKK